MEPLSDNELNVIRDQDFLVTKASVLAKIQKLLTETRSELNLLIQEGDFEFHFPINHTTAKISRGENYESLPYQILDFPAKFTQKDTFAFRTMFWWGHFFSFTLHLEGESFEKHIPKISNNLEYFKDTPTWISIGKSPWEYHFREDNYQLLQSSDKERIQNLPFLKISRKISLDQWEILPQASASFLNNILNMIV